MGLLLFVVIFSVALVAGFGQFALQQELSVSP